jgi:hypothetical protein
MKFRLKNKNVASLMFFIMQTTSIWGMNADNIDSEFSQNYVSPSCYFVDTSQYTFFSNESPSKTNI